MRRLYDEVEMIAHQTIGMHLPLRLATGTGERFQEENPIL
jgi:hypothetical protein